VQPASDKNSSDCYVLPRIVEIIQFPGIPSFCGGRPRACPSSTSYDFLRWGRHEACLYLIPGKTGIRALASDAVRSAHQHPTSLLNVSFLGSAGFEKFHDLFVTPLESLMFR
jgi:hypothetical protein